MGINIKPKECEESTNTEIERKFLVNNKSIPGALTDFPHKHIRQGYVTTKDPSTVRLRHKGDSYYITVKTGKGLKRNEYETEISEKAFNTLWEATKGRRLEKVRYEIAGNEGLKYELDIYEGDLKGFFTIEVEFESLAEAKKFTPPEWFGKDVSEDKRYSNSSLASNGIPTA